MTSQKFRTSRRAIARGAFRNASLKTERDSTMKTNKKNTGIKVTTGINAGGFPDRNHSRSGLKVKVGVRAGSMIQVSNHSRAGLIVRASVKAGSMIQVSNHSLRLLAI
jgi:hypothetical protein